VVTFLEAKTKGWKESNFQVTAAYFGAIADLGAKANPYPDRIPHMCVPVMVDKLGDVKVS
jgi:hypothetical protein